jgi:hypothetical protein
MFLLTFDESFSPCIHNEYGSSRRSVDVISVPAASSFFQKALASVLQSSFYLSHISISSREISWCAGTWRCEKLIGSQSRNFLVAIIRSKEFCVAVAFCSDQICNTEPIHSHFQRTLIHWICGRTCIIVQLQLPQRISPLFYS